MESNTSACVPLTWSAKTIDTIQPSFYVCIVAVVLHSVFWFSIFAYSSPRQRESMQWPYAFLIIDLFLLIRFFLLYGFRRSLLCASNSTYTFVCYVEAVVGVYFNCLQNYILLALNICRYLQIRRADINFYASHRRLMFAAHCLIYLLPLILLILEIEFDRAVLYYHAGGSCYLQFLSLIIRILNTILIYIFPIILTLIYLIRSLQHISLTVATMRIQRIIDARLKHHRLLIFQSLVFYSAWVLLWSPHVIVSQYVYVLSEGGIITQLLNYIELTLDPIIITVIDAHVLKICRKMFRQIKVRMASVVPM